MNKPDLLPFRDLSPAACREMLKVVTFVEEKLTLWGVRIPQQAEMHHARRWLEQLGKRDGLEDLTDDDLRKTSLAVALVVDLYHVSISLGDEPNEHVRAELSYLVRSHPSTAKYREFVAQFWVGTLLAQSHLQPRIQTGSRDGESQPDFYAEWGGVDFAVEVKCPGTPAGAQRLVADAARQLRGKVQPGVIALDLTFALGIDPFQVTRDSIPLRDRTRAAHGALYEQLVTEIRERRRDDKYARVAVLLTFARYWSWHVGERAERDAGLVFSAFAFDHACEGLITRQSRGFQEALPEGVSQLTGNPPRVVRR
jgi:hypothetical protein